VRITVDATSLLVRSAGVKNYVYHWLRSLRQAAGTGEEIRAFPFLRDLAELDHERSPISRFGTWPRLALVHAANRWGAPVLDGVIGNTGIYHAANLVRVAPTRARLTATVHDLTCWITPEHHLAANVAADRDFAERILKRAHGLIAVSENTRQDAMRLLGIAPERIRTIYSGIAREYFDARPTVRARPYVLCVGTVEPRKNLGVLLDAWKSLKPELRSAHDLVIAGPEGWNSAATMARIRAETVYLGYVPELELPGLFAGAAAFVYPSLYEGFGFPVVQAMAAGTPVVTSNTSCLPEVTGGAAVLVDPRSTAELASALARLLESPEQRVRLAKAGRARAREFQWSRCAKESLDFFRALL
jgi:glycosyltransferase involved in cell wall biosynthesis